MPEDEGEENKQFVSKYNSAVAQLQRIDELLKDAHRHSRAGRYVQWNADLDRIWCELAGNMKDSSEHEKKYNEFIKRLGAAGNITKKDTSGFSSHINSVEDSKQYTILMNKEIWLRQLQNALKMGGKEDMGEDDYMD